MKIGFLSLVSVIAIVCSNPLFGSTHCRSPNYLIVNVYCNDDAFRAELRDKNLKVAEDKRYGDVYDLLTDTEIYLTQGNDVIKKLLQDCSTALPTALKAKTNEDKISQVCGLRKSLILLNKFSLLLTRDLSIISMYKKNIFPTNSRFFYDAIAGASVNFILDSFLKQIDDDHQYLDSISSHQTSLKSLADSDEKNLMLNILESFQGFFKEKLTPLKDLLQTIQSLPIILPIKDLKKKDLIIKRNTAQIEKIKSKGTLFLKSYFEILEATRYMHVSLVKCAQHVVIQELQSTLESLMPSEMRSITLESLLTSFQTVDKHITDFKKGLFELKKKSKKDGTPFLFGELNVVKFLHSEYLMNLFKEKEKKDAETSLILFHAPKILSSHDTDKQEDKAAEKISTLPLPIESKGIFDDVVEKKEVTQVTTEPTIKEESTQAKETKFVVVDSKADVSSGDEKTDSSNEVTQKSTQMPIESKGIFDDVVDSKVDGSGGDEKTDSSNEVTPKSIQEKEPKEKAIVKSTVYSKKRGNQKQALATVRSFLKEKGIHEKLTISFKTQLSNFGDLLYTSVFSFDKSKMKEFIGNLRSIGFSMTLKSGYGSVCGISATDDNPLHLDTNVVITAHRIHDNDIYPACYRKFIAEGMIRLFGITPEIANAMRMII